MSKFFQTLRGLRALSSGASQSSAFLKRKSDFPSVEEFIVPHQQMLEKKRDMKGMFTSDPITISVVDSIVGNISSNKHHKDALSFFEKNIFSQPNHSTQEKASIKVKISSIDVFQILDSNIKQIKISL